MNIQNIERNLMNICNSLRVSFKETILTVFRTKDYCFSFSEARMLIIAHSLEKGMGLINTRKGYGQKNALKLCDCLIEYQKVKPDSNDFCFIESLGILKEYVHYQENDKIEITAIKDKYDLIINKINVSQWNEINKYRFGVSLVTKEEILNQNNLSYEKIISSRHSTRAFSDEIINETVINEAIRLANYAPSACNRQPIKVYCALGKENARKINELLTGNKSFTDSVNNFAIITSDRAYFAGDEQYQWYVNGGIYLGYFIEALHSLGIGSCIMQWFAFSKNEKKLKTLLGIKKSEAVIAVVCFGYYLEINKFICAQRKEPEKTVNFYKK